MLNSQAVTLAFHHHGIAMFVRVQRVALGQSDAEDFQR